MIRIPYLEMDAVITQWKFFGLVRGLLPSVHKHAGMGSLSHRQVKDVMILISLMGMDVRVTAK